jgi:hypothetical protein
VSGWEDVRRIAMALPGSEERLSRERLQWRVGGKLFVWERPLREKEVLELGAAAPDGPVMGARVEHLIAKEALLAEDPALFFTTSHFQGSASVLVRLEEIGKQDLEEIVTEAWFARAPPKLAAAEAQRPRGRG